MKIGFIESFLIQVVFYTLAWLWDDFIGLFLCLTFIAIAFLIMFVSIIAEMIERSRVPRSYFYHMTGAIIAPLLVLLLFFFVNGGLPDLSF